MIFRHDGLEVAGYLRVAPVPVELRRHDAGELLFRLCYCYPGSFPLLLKACQASKLGLI